MAMTEDMARKMVGRPLSPAVLEEIQALNEFPRVSPGFDPAGSWMQVYRIWLNHGFYGLLNLNAGFLRIERRKGVNDSRFTLAVEQQSIHWEGIANTIRAEISCSADPIATPLSWSCTSRFSDTKGEDVPELTVTHTARNDGGTVTCTINGSPSVVRAGESVTADWCLFEAVQRLPLGEGVAGVFDVLDGVTALKRSHRLSYRVVAADAFKNLAMPLHCFCRIGDGVLPYEYWLDNDHRLLMAISGNRLYILDDNAERTFAEEVAAHRGGKFSWQNQL